MAEYDTARSIIKNLCPRDPPTGEIAYTRENEGEVKTALLAGVYCVEKQGLGKKLERVWFDISPEIVDNVNYEYGEVLNRPVTPCWWRQMKCPYSESSFDCTNFPNWRNCSVYTVPNHHAKFQMEIKK